MTTPFDDPNAELAWMCLQCLCMDGDIDEGFALLRDDFTYWSILTRASLDKAAFRREVEKCKGRVQLNLELIRCVNDGDSVVIEAQGDGVTTEGVRYDSPYVFLFETDDGLIVSMREYSDTRLTAEVFPDSVALER